MSQAGEDLVAVFLERMQCGDMSPKHALQLARSARCMGLAGGPMPLDCALIQWPESPGDDAVLYTVSKRLRRQGDAYSDSPDLPRYLRIRENRWTCGRSFFLIRPDRPTSGENAIFSHIWEHVVVPNNLRHGR